MSTQPQLGRTAWADRPIRPLAIGDVPACVALAANRGWSAEEHKWRLLLSIGNGYGVDDPSGGLAGCVVGTRYGPRLAGIGMMLVAEQHARQGIGGRLMRHTMAATGAATYWLTATDFGKPLYEKLGFRVIDGSTQYVGRYRGDAGAATVSRPVTPADLPAIRAMDAAVFGADRSAVLSALPSFADRFRLVEGPAGLLGYGGAWRNVDTTVVGPVVADSAALARALLADLCAGVTGPVRLDLVHSRPEQIAWARAHGLCAGSTTAVMIHGADLPGDRARLHTPLMVAMG